MPIERSDMSLSISPAPIRAVSPPCNTYNCNFDHTRKSEYIKRSPTITFIRTLHEICTGPPPLLLTFFWRNRM
jgi:hypothetical protein